MRYLILALVVLMVTAVGCSTGMNSTAPEAAPVDPGDNAASVSEGHSIWGMWQFICDPVQGTVDVFALRDAELHLNGLKFLEPPAGLYLSVEGSPHWTGNVLDVDIGLRHPFLGLPQFTGFDVCGIFIGHGSISGFADPDLHIAGEGDTRLINADGYTRWWNPSEFPYNEATPIFGYIDGEMGVPDSEANFSATLNGYKYFADYLNPGDPVWLADVDMRGAFSAGQKNVRHYTIELDNGFVFNYAVDANWKSCGLPPSQIDVPDSFSPEANRPEPWGISVTEIDNSLYYELTAQGGNLSLDIMVFDWFDADENTVYAESLSGINPTYATEPFEGGANYSTYHLDLGGENLTTSGDIEILVTVESNIAGYGGLLPGMPVSSYFIYGTEVDDEAPQQAESVFYVCGDKTVFEYGVLYANNEQWLKNMYRKATGECADNPIVKFYHGHKGFEMPCSQKDLIFSWITGDGYTPVQSFEEPIDTTNCRHIHITMPGRYEPAFYSNEEIAELKQFVADGGILAIFAEVGYAHPDKTTYDHLIQSLGSGCAWAGDYTLEGTTFNTTLFDHEHPMFEGCTEIYWNLPAYVSTSLPTDNVIAWGLNGEAMFVECPIS